MNHGYGTPEEWARVFTLGFDRGWRQLYESERMKALHWRWLQQRTPEVRARIFKLNKHPHVPGTPLRGWRPKNGRALCEELDLMTLKDYEKQWGFWPERNRYNKDCFIKIGRRKYVTRPFYEQSPFTSY